MILTFSDLLSGIRERKATLGIVDSAEHTEAMRNKDSRRTPQKQAMLAQIEERARAAGVAPFKAYF